MAKKFEGELNYINPAYLITKEKFNRVESFFLGLGVIFNDLKGFILFEHMLFELYEKPDVKEPNYHLGNFSGVLVQLQKLFAGTINEFFIFLKKNREVFTDQEFKEILTKIPKENRQHWDAMVAAAHNRLPTVTDLLKTIVYVRSNVAFHYDHSGKILRKAYISRFFNNPREDANSHAFYSFDNKGGATRFYFADAAVEESLHIAAGKKSEERSIGNLSLDKYNNQIKETIVVMSATLSCLLNQYIILRRNRPHS